MLSPEGNYKMQSLPAPSICTSSAMDMGKVSYVAKVLQYLESKGFNGKVTAQSKRTAEMMSIGNITTR